MCWETCQSYEEPLLDGEEFPFCTTKACEAPKTFILLSPAVTALLPKAKWEFSGCESAVCCVRPALCWALREWRPLGRGDPECSGSEELFSLSFFLFPPPPSFSLFCNFGQRICPHVPNSSVQNTGAFCDCRPGTLLQRCASVVAMRSQNSF